jgi:hypothetical protein
VRSGQHSGVNPLHGHSGRAMSADHSDKEVVNLSNCFEALVDIDGFGDLGFSVRLDVGEYDDRDKA